jgi:hypothetical protein
LRVVHLEEAITVGVAVLVDIELLLGQVGVEHPQSLL